MICAYWSAIDFMIIGRVICNVRSYIHEHKYHAQSFELYSCIVNTNYLCYHRLNSTSCFLMFTNCVLLFDKKSNTRMLVTLGISFKQHFDTRYLVFYNPSPPRMLLYLDLLWEYRIQHGANGPLYVKSSQVKDIYCNKTSIIHTIT